MILFLSWIIALETNPRSITEMNDLMASAFRREFGRDAHLELPRWWAAKLREAIKSMDPDNQLTAAWRWGRLSRRQQQDRMLALLQGGVTCSTR